MVALEEQKLFCFRFDIDTHRCMRQGIPALLNLAKEFNVHFTFFVNMGRAVYHLNQFKKCLLKTTKSDDNYSKLSSLERLGWKDYLFAAILNPFVGTSSPDMLKKLQQQGHELGLHGGMNHAKWQCNARTWTQDKIKDQVEKAIYKYRMVTGSVPKGFSSPGWQGGDKVNNVLKELKFIYVADNHKLYEKKIVKKFDNLIRVKTNLCGEPGGIGYLEHLALQRNTLEQNIQIFRQDLALCNQLAIAYDHPCFAGTKGIHLLRTILTTLLNFNYKLVTISDIIKYGNIYENCISTKK